MLVLKSWESRVNISREGLVCVEQSKEKDDGRGSVGEPS